MGTLLLYAKCLCRILILLPDRIAEIPMNPSALIEKLKQIVGKENVLTDAADLHVYAYDATPLLHQHPLAAVHPPDEQAVQQLLYFANEANIGLIPRGSGTGLAGSAVPAKDSVVVLFHRWNKILEIDEENLTAWVQPGVITARLHEAVEERGLFYPPDPGSMKICTIGGNVAENSGGLRGLKYGVTANYVMGIEGFLPTGTPLCTGNKCVKDVAGYNIKQLLVGSEGTLAIFTRILLKLIPRPQSTRTLLALFNTMEDAAATVSDIIYHRIIPVTLEFLDQITINCVEDFAHIGLPRTAEALLLIESDGHPAVVAEEIEAIEQIARKHHALSLQVARNQAEANRLKQARRAAFSALARMRPTTILEDVTVPRSELSSMVATIRHIAKKYQLLIGLFGHAGDGNLHPTILCDERDKEEMHRVEQALEAIFQAAVEYGGTITGEHGVGLAKQPFFEKLTNAGTLELMRQVRRVVDPNRILNPDKILSPRPRCESVNLTTCP